MSCVLAAIDFSDVTDALLGESSRLARVMKLKLWLLHVAPDEPAFV